MRGVFHSPSCWKQSTFSPISFRFRLDIPIISDSLGDIDSAVDSAGGNTEKTQFCLVGRTSHRDGREVGTERIRGEKIAPPVLSTGGAITHIAWLIRLVLGGIGGCGAFGIVGCGAFRPVLRGDVRGVHAFACLVAVRIVLPEPLRFLRLHPVDVCEPCVG